MVVTHCIEILKQILIAMNDDIVEEIATQIIAQIILFIPAKNL